MNVNPPRRRRPANRAPPRECRYLTWPNARSILSGITISEFTLKVVSPVVGAAWRIHRASHCGLYQCARVLTG
ncbi:MAG TPA: hypothetical protein VFY40_23490, partial [Blastocatellia bacterium]|nr:hypothetical protein [Blastocatellia bacterium]